LVFVSVGDDIRPRPVRERIEPLGAAEMALVEAARQRREQRLTRWAKRRDLATGTQSRESEPLPTSNGPPSAQAGHADPATTWRFESVRSVLPEDALFGDTMFAGKLLMDIDEAGGILSMRYCRGLVMTACLDALDFYSPISSNEVVTFKAGLNHVGTSSLEVGVKVLTEVPWTGEVRHACTAYLSFVHLGMDMRPRPCPTFEPSTAGERRRWQGAVE